MLFSCLLLTYVRINFDSTLMLVDLSQRSVGGYCSCKTGKGASTLISSGHKCISSCKRSMIGRRRTADTIKVLWSYGDKDPIFDEMKGHGVNRGVKPLHLMAPMARKPSYNRDVRQWDLTVKNVTIESNMDTLYWCKILRAPILQDKHHIVGYEALLTKEKSTKKSIVHHMTLFECSSSSYPGSDPLSWDVWVKSNGAVCNTNLLTWRDWDSCVTPIAVWVVGSTGQFLPHHVGIPMGGRSGAKYYMLEIHYD